MMRTTCFGALVMAVVATGCASSEQNSVAAGPALPDVACIDASGENSTLDVMAHAFRYTPYLRARGHLRSENDESYYWWAGQPDDPFDPAAVAAYVSPVDDAVLMYADTPAGGDAAFGTAVCGLEFEWKMGLTESQFATAVGTPGFLRGLGRRICSEIERSGDPIGYLDDVDQDLVDAEGHADGFVEFSRKMLGNSLSDRLSYLESPVDPGDLPDNRRIARHDVIDLQDAIALLDHETDEHLLRVARDRVAFTRAALEYQCPAL